MSQGVDKMVVVGFTALDFAEVARALGATARAAGLVVPTFRSPPRLAGVERSLRRRPDGGATVSIALRGRPRPAILADMVEGVVATNHLGGAPADRTRSVLWLGLGEPAHGSVRSERPFDRGSGRAHHNRRFGQPGSRLVPVGSPAETPPAPLALVAPAEDEELAA